MNNAELRDLLERVEAHGGPFGSEKALDVFIRREDGKAWTVSRIADDLVVQDQFVGVLKRDLIERGLEPTSRYRQGHWYARAWNGDESRRVTRGDSELEALLTAWLAAAEAEGWK